MRITLSKQSREKIDQIEELITELGLNYSIDFEDYKIDITQFVQRKEWIVSMIANLSIMLDAEEGIE